MKLTIGVKLFIAYFIVTSSIVWLVADKVAFRITNGIDQAAEEIMIDSANLLAQMVSNNIHNNEISFFGQSTHNLCTQINERHKYQQQSSYLSMVKFIKKYFLFMSSKR